MPRGQWREDEQHNFHDDCGVGGVVVSGGGSGGDLLHQLVEAGILSKDLSLLWRSWGMQIE